jgi:hypothetical protein
VAPTHARQGGAGGGGGGDDDDAGRSDGPAGPSASAAAGMEGPGIVGKTRIEKTLL